MARYFAGTRGLLYGRSSSSISFNTTVGSPKVFDDTVDGVDGSVLIPYGGINGALIQPYCSVALNATPTEVWVHVEYFCSQSGVTTLGLGENFITFHNSAGDVVAGIRCTTNLSNASTIYLNNASALVLTGAVYSLVLNTLTGMDIRCVVGASGTLEVYQGGTLLAGRTWVNGAVTDIAFVRFTNVNNGGAGTHFSQAGISDFDMRGYKFPSQVLTGTGNYNDGTGTPAQTGDLDFTTNKGLPANNNQFSGTKPALTFPTGSVLDGVTVNKLVRAGSPIGNAQVLVRTGGVDGYSANVAPAPGGGYAQRSTFLAVNPATGLAWNAADYNSSEFGVRALT